MIDRLDEVRGWIDRSIATGRLAHAYLLAGDQPQTVVVAEYILRSLFSDNADDEATPTARRIAGRTHPDISWIEPESKSRVIKIEQIRELIKRLSSTSFYGGWKAGVVLGADRFNQESANSFLKLLEEPPSKCILLLLSEHHDDLLPTIRSRCQLISLRQGTQLLPAGWSEALLEILRRCQPSGLLQVFDLSRRLQAILESEKEQAESEVQAPMEGCPATVKEKHDARISARVLSVRHEILKWMIMWHRDVLMITCGAGPDVLHFQSEHQALHRQAEGLGTEAALAILDEVEKMAKRLERPIPESLVFDDSLMELASIAYKSKATSRG